MNVYQDAPSRSRVESEGVKTEDVYQTLHHPPSVKKPNSTQEPVRTSRLTTVLLIFNTLLLVVIVILIGLYNANQLQLAEVNKPESQSTEVNELKASGEDSEREELWRLHDDVFYLFWEAEGSCTEALNFCEDRNSRIATTSSWDGLFDHDWSFLGEPFYHPANPDHVDWILSQANGRKLWMNMDGDTTGHLNETLRQCPLDEENPADSEGMQGWVCEVRPQGYRHYRGYRGFRDMAAPERESPAASAASVLSVKIYIITVSVLASLRPLNF